MSAKDARTLLNQADAVESVAKALCTWVGLLKGMVVPPGGSEEVRRPTREVFKLIVRHAPLLRRLLNEFGCHEYIRHKLTSMLDVASRAEMGEDVGGYWSRMGEYAGEHLCEGLHSVPDELAKWVRRLRTEAANCPEPEEERKPQGDRKDALAQEGEAAAEAARADLAKGEGAKAPAPRPTTVDRTADFILAVFRDRPEAEKRKYLKAAAVLPAIKEKHPDFDRKHDTIERKCAALVKAGRLQSKTNAGYRLPQEQPGRD